MITKGSVVRFIGDLEATRHSHDISEAMFECRDRGDLFYVSTTLRDIDVAVCVPITYKDGWGNFYAKFQDLEEIDGNNISEAVEKLFMEQGAAAEGEPVPEPEDIERVPEEVPAEVPGRVDMAEIEARAAALPEWMQPADEGVNVARPRPPEYYAELARRRYEAQRVIAPKLRVRGAPRD